MITIEEMSEKGYVDVAGNVGIDELQYEMGVVERTNFPSQIIVIHNPASMKANIYIPKEDFGKKKAK